MHEEHEYLGIDYDLYPFEMQGETEWIAISSVGRARGLTREEAISDIEEIIETYRYHGNGME